MIRFLLIDIPAAVPAAFVARDRRKRPGRTGCEEFLYGFESRILTGAFRHSPCDPDAGAPAPGTGCAPGKSWLVVPLAVATDPDWTFAFPGHQAA